MAYSAAMNALLREQLLSEVLRYRLPVDRSFLLRGWLEFGRSGLAKATIGSSMRQFLGDDS